MSKQSEAKTKQGYVSKAVPQTCMNCAHFRSAFVLNGYGFKEEKNLLCMIGGFAVKKMGTCNEFTEISNPST